MIRSGGAEQRKTALELLESLVNEPPWWFPVRSRLQRAIINREFTRLLECVELAYAC